jgi:hypothetical protein
VTAPRWAAGWPGGRELPGGRGPRGVQRSHAAGLRRSFGGACGMLGVVGRGQLALGRGRALGRRRAVGCSHVAPARGCSPHDAVGDSAARRAVAAPCCRCVRCCVMGSRRPPTGRPSRLAACQRAPGRRPHWRRRRAAFRQGRLAVDARRRAPPGVLNTDTMKAPMTSRMHQQVGSREALKQ